MVPARGLASIRSAAHIFKPRLALKSSYTLSSWLKNGSFRSSQCLDVSQCRAISMPMSDTEETASPPSKPNFVKPYFIHPYNCPACNQVVSQQQLEKHLLKCCEDLIHAEVRVSICTCCDIIVFDWARNRIPIFVLWTHKRNTDV